MTQNPNIKILFAIGRLSVGGAEKLLVHQLRAITASRFDPYLITLFNEQRESLADKVSLDANHWQQLHFKSFFDVGSWRALMRFFKEERFDVVVTSLFSANLMVRIAAVFARVPVIVSYEHNLYPDKNAWQIFADRMLARRTDRILVDGESVRAFTARQERIPREKFLTMHIPSLLEKRASKDERLVRRELNIPEHAPVILTVSRLVPEKGHRYLIAAAETVIAKFPHAYFLMVGWGPLQDSLKTQATALGILDHVRIPGRMDIADVLPLASIYVEPAITVDIGIALMEAMDAAKPIIATKVGEMPFFIKDGENGLLVPPNDSTALADRIMMLLGDRAYAAMLARAAKETSTSFSFTQYMQTFERLVLDLHDKKLSGSIR